MIVVIKMCLLFLLTWATVSLFIHALWFTGLSWWVRSSRTKVTAKWIRRNRSVVLAHFQIAADMMSGSNTIDAHVSCFLRWWLRVRQPIMAPRRFEAWVDDQIENIDLRTTNEFERRKMLRELEAMREDFAFAMLTLLRGDEEESNVGS